MLGLDVEAGLLIIATSCKALVCPYHFILPSIMYTLLKCSSFQLYIVYNCSQKEIFLLTSVNLKRFNIDKFTTMHRKIREINTICIDNKLYNVVKTSKHFYETYFEQQMNSVNILLIGAKFLFFCCQ